MIGMMYLVLTALLALNVSKEIINAFVTIDDALNVTVSNKLPGIYDLRLLNVNGQVLFVQKLKHAGGIGIFSVKLPVKYSGLHRIEMVCPNRTNFVENLLMVNGH